MEPSATKVTNSTNSFMDDFVDQSKQIYNDALYAAQLAEQEAEWERDCDSDAVLASMLQEQINLEYEHQLVQRQVEMESLNCLSELINSPDRPPEPDPNSRSADSDEARESTEEEELQAKANGNHAGDDDTETELENSAQAAWDNFELNDIRGKGRVMRRTGFGVDEGGNLITKHDIPTSSRKNMCRLMELKTDIETGDAGDSKDDFKITNYVYNRLRDHSKKVSRKTLQRLFDKKERENMSALQDIQACKMSDLTRAIMNGLMVAYKIEKLNGVIGYGKESTVLHATGRDHEDSAGQEVAIKIFKSDKNMAFKTRDTYNKSKCPSYKFDKPRSKNDVLNKWAERGFKNLKLLRKHNINCPDPISLRKHVLIMTFLGSDACPSPQLRQAHLTPEQLKSSYDQVIDIMKVMYDQCNLIHGDLSEYNLIWHNDQVYIIDVSQSMFTWHPNANSFLYRDCKNILNFYTKSGLQDVMEVKTLFELISHKDLTDKDAEMWAKIEEFPANEKLMLKEEDTGDKLKGVDSFTQLYSSKNDGQMTSSCPPE